MAGGWRTSVRLSDFDQITCRNYDLSDYIDRLRFSDSSFIKVHQSNILITVQIILGVNYSQMTNEKYLTQAEALDVETAMLSTHEKFLARITISSLRLLQQIAQEEQVKVEDLTPKQITQWFERDAAVKRSQGETAGSLQW